MAHTKAAIIGAGEIGSAIAKLLQPTKCTLAVFDKNPLRMPTQLTLPEALQGAQVVFLCVASWVLEGCLQEIRPLLSKRMVVVTLAKGIQADTGWTVDQVLAKALPPDQPQALLSGPMLAEELLLGQPGFAVVATKDAAVFRTVQHLFAGTALHVEHGVDVHGVALAGVLKNVFAVAVGIATGLGYGSNVRGWLGSKTIIELCTAVELLGGKRSSGLGTAGIGDFLCTGWSEFSSNHEVGLELVRTGTCTKRCEGVAALPQVVTMLGDRISDFPMITALRACVLEHKPAGPVFAQLFETYGN